MIIDDKFDKIITILSTASQHETLDGIFEELGADFQLYKQMVDLFRPDRPRGESIPEDALQIIRVVWDKYQVDGDTLLKIIPFIFAFLKAKDFLYSSLDLAHNDLLKKTFGNLLERGGKGAFKVTHEGRDQ